MSNFKSFWADKYHAIITQAKYSWIRSSRFFFSQGSVNPHHAKFPMRRRKEQEDGWPSPYSLMVLLMSSPRNKDRKQQQGEDGERGSLNGKSTWASWNTTIASPWLCLYVLHLCEGSVYLSIITNDGTWTDLMLLLMLCLISAVQPADIAQGPTNDSLNSQRQNIHPQWAHAGVHQPTYSIKQSNQPIRMCYTE